MYCLDYLFYHCQEMEKEILLSLQANELACPSFVSADRTKRVLDRSESTLLLTAEERHEIHVCINFS